MGHAKGGGNGDNNSGYNNNNHNNMNNNNSCSKKSQHMIYNIYEQQQPLQQTEPEQFSAIITVGEHDIRPVPALAEYNLAAVEQNSSPTFRARIPHSGPDQGQLLHQPRIHNIPTGWPRPDTVAARQECNKNQQHLLKLLMEKMQDMDAEINSLKMKTKV
jgi:hypothetical protein